jgi:hypothetical protein
MDTAIEIMKWALLILLAGFIGQFGKSLSLRVIHYFQDKKKKKISPATVAGQGADRTIGLASSEPDGKREKKMLKAQIKSGKKREKLQNKGE